MKITPRAELRQRLVRLQAAMQEAGIDACFIIERANLYYFSGTAQLGRLFVPARGEPVLLVRKNYDRAMRETKLGCVVVPEPALDNLPDKLRRMKQPVIRTMGLELDVLPASIYLKHRAAFPEAQIVDISLLVREIRAVKTPYELSIMREASLANTRVFSAAARFLREGLTEVEFSSRLEALARADGHQGFVRVRRFNQEVWYAHVMAGGSLAQPTFIDGPVGGHGVSPAFPQGATHRLISWGEPIMIDFTSVRDGYMVDETRVFCIGCLPAELREAHRVSLQIQATLEREARPGVPCADLYARAAEMARESGFGHVFMGWTPDRVSFVGHGVGLELDELPVIAPSVDIPLKAGMVLAIEPKFVFPGLGAVGVENTFVVTTRGLHKFSSYPDEIQIRN